MNNNHSRWLKPLLAKALTAFPVVPGTAGGHGSECSSAPLAQYEIDQRSVKMLGAIQPCRKAIRF
jgi:hypothetical protein